MTNFDKLCKKLILLAEGRKPKVYSKYIIDFDKLQEGVNSLSDENPFKKIYLHSIERLKNSSVEGGVQEKTLPEWEEAIYQTFAGQALSKSEKKRFTDRFFNFIKDPDREYLDEIPTSNNPSVNPLSVEEHIYNFIKSTDSESATESDIQNYAARYGVEGAELSAILDKLVKDGSLKKENGTYTILGDLTLDDIDDIEEIGEIGDDWFSDSDVENDESLNIDNEELPDDIAKDYGIDRDDPFKDSDYEESNYKYD